MIAAILLKEIFDAGLMERVLANIDAKIIVYRQGKKWRVL